MVIRQNSSGKNITKHIYSSSRYSTLAALMKSFKKSNRCTLQLLFLTIIISTFYQTLINCISLRFTSGRDKLKSIKVIEN